MPDFSTEYQDLTNFIQNIETKISDNLQAFNETLSNRYKDWSYKIEQIQNKKLFYLKNLDKFEQIFKQQNNFSSLKEELRFFQNYSQIMDDKTDEIETEVEKEKAKIAKNRELIKKYRALIKDKMRQNTCFKTIVSTNVKPSDAKENINAVAPPEHRFFLTENSVPNDRPPKPSINKSVKINININYNFFIECLNIYFNAYLKQSRVSNPHKQPDYDFEIVSNLHDSIFDNKKTISKNILDLLKTKVGSENNSMAIKKNSKLYAAVSRVANKEGIGVDLGSRGDLRVEGIPWEVFRGFSAGEVFLALLYKLQVINVIVFEWQDCIKMNYKGYKRYVGQTTI